MSLFDGRGMGGPMPTNLAEMGRGVGQSISRGLLNPYMESKGYVSQENQILEIMKQADLTDANSVSDTFNKIMMISPEAAAEFQKQVLPMLQANQTQQQLEAPQTEKLLAFEKKIMRINQLDISQEEKDEMIKKALSGVTTEINMGGQDKYADAVGKGRAERDMAIIDNADLAIEGFEKTNQALELLAGGNEELITGFGANQFLDIERFGTKIGAIKGGRVANTQYLEALLGSDVFPMIKALGIGARGLVTPQERIFLQKVMTGDITMDNESIERLTRLRQKYYKRAINKYNERLRSGKFKLYEDSLSTDEFEYKLEELPIPESYVKPKGPVIPEGAIIAGTSKGRTIYKYLDGTYHLEDGTEVQLPTQTER